MPTFDVVSEVDHQEVRNAVDQTDREISTRFDFKGTDSTVELAKDGKSIDMHANAEPRLKALVQVLEEKFAKRHISMKALSYGPIEDAAKGSVKQTAKLVEGITTEKAKEIGKYIKENFKGLSHSIQGDQLRVQGKKRDDLQDAIQALKNKDFGLPLQFTNFRD